MNVELINEIQQVNKWLVSDRKNVFFQEDYVPRLQEPTLLNSEWEKYWTILIGPRRAGKTTLGKHLAQQILNQPRFETLLYLNCDLPAIRKHFHSPTLLQALFTEFKLTRPIVFIDEAQRLENPGLLLKAIVDLHLPIKLIASGSSQLEMKSNIQEYLTGRELESVVLPFSCHELKDKISMEQILTYGTYPQIIQTNQKKRVLFQLYNRYIKKDIIEILKLSKPDVLEKLIVLIAHSSGQLVNYQQLATDCRVSSPTIQAYLDILENTYILAKIKPFSGNKRTEITNNPKYYFIDNGFRNQALRNFTSPENRTDIGLLVESLVFQELFKYKTQHFYDFDIFYWRTKSGAEVDFIAYKNEGAFIPIEVKYRRMLKPMISRGYRSFLAAYQPKQAIIVTHSYLGEITIDNTCIYFIPLEYLHRIFPIIKTALFVT